MKITHPFNQQPSLEKRVLDQHIALARTWSRVARLAKRTYDQTDHADACKVSRLYDYLNARSARHICMQLAKLTRAEFQPGTRREPVTRRVPVFTMSQLAAA